jgi:hypothetical protein
MTVTSFRICVSDEVLDDLRVRLIRTRFTAALACAGDGSEP